MKSPNCLVTFITISILLISFIPQISSEIILNSKLDTSSMITEETPLESTTINAITKQQLDNEHDELNELEIIFLDFINQTFLGDKIKYEIVSGVNILPDPNVNHTTITGRGWNDVMEDGINGVGKSFPTSFNQKIMNSLEHFAETHVLNVNIPRAVETGRLFFFKGLKKLMWPIVIGIQIAKTILLAMFLPSILGSFGKILGKGVSGLSGLHQHGETVDDLDFKDNGLNSDIEAMGESTSDYNYGDDAANNLAQQMYDSKNSRLGPGGQRVTYVNSPTHFYSKGTNTIMSTKKDDFKVFHDIPASSLLLTNYDPFYSPLLSRLDAVYQQLGYGVGNEKCREKLVCQMYANPAKYAPYSNLVSAQLSRELNQLKKPLSDNPDILRFFRYMKAAKDGQDGVMCEDAYNCKSQKESSDPIMLNTYNDINKLVQARKMVEN